MPIPKQNYIPTNPESTNWDEIDMNNLEKQMQERPQYKETINEKLAKEKNYLPIQKIDLSRYSRTRDIAPKI
jgi:hypothetical protein